MKMKMERYKELQEARKNLLERWNTLDEQGKKEEAQLVMVKIRDVEYKITELEEELGIGDPEKVGEDNPLNYL